MNRKYDRHGASGYSRIWKEMMHRYASEIQLLNSTILSEDWEFYESVRMISDSQNKVEKQVNIGDVNWSDNNEDSNPNRDLTSFRALRVKIQEECGGASLRDQIGGFLPVTESDKSQDERSSSRTACTCILNSANPNLPPDSDFLSL